MRIKAPFSQERETAIVDIIAKNTLLLPKVWLQSLNILKD